MRALFLALGLAALTIACTDTGVRRGTAADVHRVPELIPGATSLAEASVILGDDPCIVSPVETGGVIAAWWSYIELIDWDPPIRKPEFVIRAQFDSAERLVAVIAADFRGKSYWYFPDFDSFEREVRCENQDP
jgi:hypothetical protein